MNKTLISGANSFIGKSFIKFHKADFSVDEFDIQNYGIDSIDLKEYDTIIHLAAIVHSSSDISKEIYFNVNSDLAYDLALKAKNNGIKQFVFLSSIKVYGENTRKEEVWNESSQCLPKDNYGASKLNAENRLEQLQDNNFNVSIIRSSVVYGPGVKANMLALIKLVSRVKILPFGSSNNQRTFVYIENLIAIIEEIIKQRKKGVFIASDGNTISTTQLVEYIAKSLNKKIWLFKFPFVHFASKHITFLNKLFSNIAIDNSNTLQKLNLNLPFSTPQGIDKTVEWYKTQGKSIK